MSGASSLESPTLFRTVSKTSSAAAGWAAISAASAQPNMNVVAKRFGAGTCPRIPTNPSNPRATRPKMPEIQAFYRGGSGRFCGMNPEHGIIQQPQNPGNDSYIGEVKNI